MRGLIFTELFELIEDKFGFETLDDIIVAAELPNDGAYAATGNYPFSELLSIVVALHNHTKLPIEVLLETFGEYLFERLLESHPQFKSTDNVLNFLENVENYIHIEVKKLYPDAELPKFEPVSKTEEAFTFYYISTKQLHHLAKGLIVGASKHFEQPLDIEMTPQEDGRVLFQVSYK
jgi:hypothetical protein